MRAPRRAIPLSEVRPFRRALVRSTILRVVLATLLVALGGVSLWRAMHLRPRAVSFLPERSTTLVVLDQSKSVYVSAYGRIEAVLRRLAAANVSVGLVIFSDTAYELVPPGTRGSDLRPLLRFYRPLQARATPGRDVKFPTNPWQNVFSGGTKISAGLELAASILRRDHVHNGTMLLLSDLGTAGEDQTRLAETLLRIEHDRRLRLKIVPLFPIQSDLAFFERFVPARDVVGPAEITAPRTSVGQSRLAAATPWPFLVAGALLLLGLMANELICGRLVVLPGAQAG